MPGKSRGDAWHCRMNPLDDRWLLPLGLPLGGLLPAALLAKRYELLVRDLAVVIWEVVLDRQASPIEVMNDVKWADVDAVRQYHFLYEWLALRSFVDVHLPRHEPLHPWGIGGAGELALNHLVQ